MKGISGNDRMDQFVLFGDTFYVSDIDFGDRLQNSDFSDGEDENYKVSKPSASRKSRSKRKNKTIENHKIKIETKKNKRTLIINDKPRETSA